MLESLRAKGHNVSEEPIPFLSVIQAITSSCDKDQRPDCIEAVCDWRKYGAPDGITTGHSKDKSDDDRDDDDNDDDAIQTSNGMTPITVNRAEL